MYLPVCLFIFQGSSLTHDLDTLTDLFYFHELLIFCETGSLDFKFLPVEAETRKSWQPKFETDLFSKKES